MFEAVPSHSRDRVRRLCSFAHDIARLSSDGCIARVGGTTSPKETPLPLFIIERQFADELEVGAEEADAINRVNDDESVRWLYSFLSADKKKTFCLYEAPSAEAIRRAAARAGLPADVITEITGRVMPDASMQEVPA